jgi:hypothetical protein
MPNALSAILQKPPDSHDYDDGDSSSSKEFAMDRFRLPDPQWGESAAVLPAHHVSARSASPAEDLLRTHLPPPSNF